MDSEKFVIILNGIINKEITDIVRPFALEKIQKKYKNLNINFMKLGNIEHIINDKLIFYTDGTQTELENIQNEYNRILYEMIYEETYKFIQYLIKIYLTDKKIKK